MHGNVWQWCSDRYGKYPATAQSDPEGPDAGSARVYRGGNWGVSPRDCRSAFRGNVAPSIQRIGLGFRLALVPSGQDN
jgi:formylglycine-generating enzyme required for sulfatase activity